MLFAKNDNCIVFINKNYYYVITSVLIFSSIGLFVRMSALSGYAIYFFAALISAIILGTIIYKESRFRNLLSWNVFWIPVSIGIINKKNIDKCFCRGMCIQNTEEIMRKNASGSITRNGYILKNFTSIKQIITVIF